MNISTPAKITGVILAILFVLVVWIVGNYNSLVGSRNQVDKSWAQIETQYQRRLDLIENIVQSAKGAQKQEQVVFGQIADARARIASGSASTSDKAAAAAQIETTITAIVPRLQEAYPDLKSNAQVQSLIDELKKTEDNIAKSRDHYNDTANNYNINVMSFPKNIFAGMFGYQKVSLYKADAGANKAPAVKF